jgi:hypothetical protein
MSFTLQTFSPLHMQHLIESMLKFRIFLYLFCEVEEATPCIVGQFKKCLHLVLWDGGTILTN